MAKVDKRTMIKKGLLRGLQYAAVTIAALQTVPVPEGIGVERQVTVAFVIGVLGAIAKAVHNYQKTSKRAPYLGSRSGYVLIVAGIAGLLAGCVTTTAPDGTVSTSVDSGALMTVWDHYEALRQRRDALEAERTRAGLTRRVEIDAELHGLEPDIRALAERLGISGG